jgi:antitoxin component YwqK of YwqJK toxin-antitoxin module
MITGGRSIFIFCVLIFFACQAEIPNSETTVRRGLIYQRGDDEPFTGYVVGSGREDYRSQTCRYKKEYKNGKLDGKSRFWYSNGQLESIEPYENGQLNGDVIRYYDNGQMKARIPMRDGMRGGGGGELFWDKHGKLRKG